MWAPELYKLKVAESPRWRIAESLNRYSERSTITPSGVFSAIFPIEELKQFDGIFRVQSWYANAKYIDLERRAGEFVLKLSLDLSGKKVILIVNGIENKLRDIDALLKQILAQTNLDDGNNFIDMSYTDKIVVIGAREGSLK
jgi:hypothetical protein